MTHPVLRRLAAITFWLLLVVWTWLLVRPNPIPEVVKAIPSAWQFGAAKLLHGGTYAALVVLGTTWPAARRGRVVVVGLLLLHGVGTEIVQTFVPNRTGRVRDVVVDWAGILAGLLAVKLAVGNRHRWGRVVPTALADWQKKFRSGGL